MSFNFLADEGKWKQNLQTASRLIVPVIRWNPHFSGGIRHMWSTEQVTTYQIPYGHWYCIYEDKVFTVRGEEIVEAELER